jgi:hypothetical protein
VTNNHPPSAARSLGLPILFNCNLNRPHLLLLCFVVSCVRELLLHCFEQSYIFRSRMTTHALPCYYQQYRTW